MKTRKPTLDCRRNVQKYSVNDIIDDNNNNHLNCRRFDLVQIFATIIDALEHITKCCMGLKQI